MNINKLKTKTALVTGASTGIGRQICLELANQCYFTLLVGRDKVKLEKTKYLIEKRNGNAKIFLCDLSKPHEINKLTKKVLKKHKKTDVIVNCAGAWHDSKKAFYNTPLQDTPEEQINTVINVQLKAPMLLIKNLLPSMTNNKGGKIINISGTFENGGSGWLHYYVTKKAIEDFTVGLSDELRKNEIQVNCISPSDTKTPAYKKFFPEYAKDAIDPQEVAKLAVFLASKDSDHITGQCIAIKNKKAYSP